MTTAALWVGGLIALLAHGRRQREHLGLATTRFSRLALVCWLVMAASGVINALVRLPLDQVFTTSYGLLVLAKLAALLLLGGIGYLQRERGVRQVVTTGSARALLRLGAIEVLIMLGTIGVAVTLARTLPPEPAAVAPDPTELILGYPLAGPPDLARLLFDWRFDIIYGTAAILAAVCYLLGVRRLRGRGETWPVGRTMAWLAGCLVVLIATSAGFGRYALAMFGVHLGLHVLLALLAPVLLVLGGPITLALRALTPANTDAPPGLREWLVALTQSPAVRVLTHPVVALALLVGPFYVLYLSGLFEAVLELRWAHAAMTGLFLLFGYAFHWPVIGTDPTPATQPLLTRLGMTFAAVPFLAAFGMVMVSTPNAIASDYYLRLGLPWLGDPLAEQRVGGGIAWVLGAAPLLAVLVVLLTRWASSSGNVTNQDDEVPGSSV